LVAAVDEVVAPAVPPGWVERDLRRLAAAVSAGAVLGFVISGWGSRLAMMLLAELNPRASGLISDDGFRIGQFGVRETTGLLVLTTALSVVGALAFVAVRHLRFGPSWFRTTSMVVGPAVVVGAALVHTDGVDFTLLQPAWLAITLFVALPGLFAWALVTLGDRWMADGSWFLTGSRWRLVTLAPLALVVPAFPLLLAVAAADVAYRTRPWVRAAVGHPAAAWAARLALTALFTVALVDLVRDTLTLT
jgi:hypothetical protein